MRPAKPEDLEHTLLFKDVPPDFLDQIAKHSSLCKLRANVSLECVRGEVNYLYLIVKGFVAIWRPSCFGPNEYTFLAWRGPGQPIGEMKALGAQQLSARIDTCDPCEFIEIRADSFYDVLQGAPIIYRNICNLLLRKMRHQGHRSEVIQMNSATGMVAQTLLHLAEDRLESDISSLTAIPIPGVILQEQLAAYAGIGREAVNIELSELRKKNIISSVGSKLGTRITILDWRSLEAIVRED